MPRTHITARPPADQSFDALRTRLELPPRASTGAHPAASDAEAAAIVADAAPSPGSWRDGFVTLDPPGSRDLDQALQIERHGDGWRVHYAIADLSAIDPRGPIATEALVRGMTLYLPDGRVPLYPESLGQGALSLLPGEPRPAVVWTHLVAADGSATLESLERALVRSRAQFDYPAEQQALDAGTADPQMTLLAEVGRALRADADRRGAVELPVPEQEVALGPDGRWTIDLRSPLPLEGWNAQLSLATGRAAGALQAGSAWGLLRTLPPPPPGSVDNLRHTARALGVPWPKETTWAALVGSLDTSNPSHLALATVAARLLRGAGYQVLAGGVPDASPPRHEGVAAVYAHATAPLRRLADRYVSECCLAAAQGVAPPGWVQDALPGLDQVMLAAGRRASTVERAVVDQVEANLLAGREGQVFPAIAVDERTVQIADPVVRATVGPGLEPGGEVEVRLVSVDLASGSVDVEVV